MAKLTIKQIDARIEAYEECIGHLEGDWTDDPTERQQGLALISVLQTQQEMWVDRKLFLQR